MNRSRLLSIVTISTLCVIFAFSLYIGNKGPKPETNQQQPTPTASAEPNGIWAGTQVTIEVTDTTTQETETLSFTSINSLPKTAFGYSFLLVESDFENYATVSVTDSEGVSETVNFTKLDVGSYQNLNLTLTNTINSPCPDGAQC